MELYQDILDRYVKDIPFVLYLKGSKGVGKRTLARKLASQITLPQYIILQENLTADEIRGLKKLLLVRPPLNQRYVVILDLEQASTKVCNILLKILEEGGSFIRFILISERQLPLTVVSRSFMMVFAPVSVEQITNVLCMDGVRREVSERTARISGGSLERAKKMLLEQGSRDVFLSVLRAIINGNLSLLMVLLGKIDEAVNEYVELFLEDFKNFCIFGKECSFRHFVKGEVDDIFSYFLNKSVLVDEILCANVSILIRLFRLGLVCGKFQGVS